MVTVSVYIDDGRVYEYDVESADKAREHLYAIVQGGYIHTREGWQEHYPVHRIRKVKAVGEGIQTNYPDRERGI